MEKVLDHRNNFIHYINIGCLQLSDMDNREISKVFKDIADILELKGASIFKIRAYRNIARTIDHLSVELDIMVKEHRLREIPGVGDAIEKKIIELVTTGKLEFYEKLKAESPDGFTTLIDIPGIGPKTALSLVNNLGIKSIVDLEKAVIDGRVAKLPRIGEKTAIKILHHIQFTRTEETD
jgi:DNA polymerase (family X)